MKKEYGLVVVVVVVVILSQLMTLESSAPAFMWSPHIHMEVQDNVNYQTLSSKALATAVMSHGTWSNLMCQDQTSPQPLDLALVFLGTQLQSSDISGKLSSDASLLRLLKNSFTRSNFSVAYPYVSPKVEEGTLENCLLQEFEESCDRKMGVGSIAVTDSCSIEDKQYSVLADMHSIQEYVTSTMEKGTEGRTNLLVVCHRGLKTLKNLEHPHPHPHPEGAVFSELLSTLDNSGAKYAVLYVSDSSNPVQHPYQLGRFLAEVPGNASTDFVFCDGVCQIKKSLLEALFVTIVLLIILISGLCCMMGIDSPTRFETPQES